MPSGKRETRPPKHLEEDFDYHGSRKRTKRDRLVYRLLRSEEITPALWDQDVYILWPEDNIWYLARVDKFDPATGKALLFYTETEEEEKDVNLRELVDERCIAFLESRPRDVELGPDEFPVADAARLGGRDAGSDDDYRYGQESDDEVLSDDEKFDSDASFDDPDLQDVLASAKRGNKKKSSKGKRRLSDDEDGGRSSKRRSSGGGGGEASLKQMSLAMLQSGKRGEGGSGAASARLSRASSGGLNPAGSGALQRQASAASEATLRRRAVEGFKPGLRQAVEDRTAALAKAIADAAAERLPPPPPPDPEALQPDPDAIAAEVEAQLFELYGAVNDDYKRQARAIAFNLKDKENKDLRAHVLSGEVTPRELARMSAADMANKEIAQWRQEREEAHDKEIVLDVETAAKFSTAAAWETRDVKIKELQAALLGAPRQTTPPPGQPGAAATDAEHALVDDGQERVAALLAARAAENGEGEGAAGSGGGGLEDPAMAHFAADMPGAAPTTGAEAAAATPNGAAALGSLAAAPSGPATRIGGGGGVLGAAALAAAATAHAIDWASVRTEAVELEQDAAQLDDSADGDDPYDPTEGYDVDEDLAAGIPGVTSDKEAEDSVADLGPIVAVPPPGDAARPPGAAVWAGRFTTPGGGGSAFSAIVSYLGGSGPLDAMLGPQGGSLEIIGRVSLDKFAAFMEELRASRSRTVTLGLAAPPPDADPLDAAQLHDTVRKFSAGRRIGRLTMPAGSGVEGYLIPQTELTARLAKTARVYCSPTQAHLVPQNAGAGELMVVIIHRKDLSGAVPKGLAPAPAAPPVPTQFAPGDPRAARLAAAAGAAAPAAGPAPGGLASALDGILSRAVLAPAAGGLDQQQQPDGGVYSPIHPSQQQGASIDPRRRAGAVAPAPAMPSPAPAGAAAAAPIDLKSLSALASALGLPPAPAAATAPAPAPAGLGGLQPVAAGGPLMIQPAATPGGVPTVVLQLPPGGGAPVPVTVQGGPPPAGGGPLPTVVLPAPGAQISLPQQPPAQMRLPPPGQQPIDPRQQRPGPGEFGGPLAIQQPPPPQQPQQQQPPPPMRGDAGGGRGGGGRRGDRRSRWEPEQGPGTGPPPGGWQPPPSQPPPPPGRQQQQQQQQPPPPGQPPFGGGTGSPPRQMGPPGGGFPMGGPPMGGPPMGGPPGGGPMHLGQPPPPSGGGFGGPPHPGPGGPLPGGFGPPPGGFGGPPGGFRGGPPGLGGRGPGGRGGRGGRGGPGGFGGRGGPPGGFGPGPGGPPGGFVGGRGGRFGGGGPPPHGGPPMQPGGPPPHGGPPQPPRWQ